MFRLSCCLDLLFGCFNHLSKCLDFISFHLCCLCWFLSFWFVVWTVCLSIQYLSLSACPDYLVDCLQFFFLGTRHRNVYKFCILSIWVFRYSVKLCTLIAQLSVCLSKDVFLGVYKVYPAFLTVWLFFLSLRLSVQSGGIVDWSLLWMFRLLYECADCLSGFAKGLSSLARILVFLRFLEKLSANIDFRKVLEMFKKYLASKLPKVISQKFLTWYKADVRRWD